MLSYKAMKDINPEDTENEMVSKKGDILRQIQDDDYKPGDEFVLCINERTQQEAYIEVAEYALHNTVVEEKPVEPEVQPQPVQTLPEVKPEQVAAKPQIDESEQHYVADQLKQDAALWESDKKRAETLNKLMFELAKAQDQCGECRLHTTSLKKRVSDFRLELQKIQMGCK